MHGKGKICRVREPFAWIRENLQGEGAICMERGTIFVEGGNHKQKQISFKG